MEIRIDKIENRTEKESRIRCFFPAFASLQGPMIASFFDGSNISADETSSDLSPVLIVEDIPIVSNWSLKTCLNLNHV